MSASATNLLCMSSTVRAFRTTMGVLGESRRVPRAVESPPVAAVSEARRTPPGSAVECALMITIGRANSAPSPRERRLGTRLRVPNRHPREGSLACGASDHDTSPDLPGDHRYTYGRRWRSDPDWDRRVVHPRHACEATSPVWPTSSRLLRRPGRTQQRRRPRGAACPLDLVTRHHEAPRHRASTHHVLRARFEVN